MEEATKERLDACVNFFKKAIGEVRIGRALPSFIENVLVRLDSSNKVPLNRLATITAPETNLLFVKVWDKKNVTAVDTTIRSSNLNLNPNTAGETIKIVIPQLSKERRGELCKACNEIAEKSRVSVRNVRKDIMEDLRKEKKESTKTEDEYYKAVDNLQSLVNKRMEKIDCILAKKKGDIMSL